MEGYFVGTYACWGIDNKETPLRVVQPTPDGVVTNLEIKSFDHTSNMYLAFAAILVCGMDGMKRQL